MVERALTNGSVIYDRGCYVHIDTRLGSIKLNQAWFHLLPQLLLRHPEMSARQQKSTARVQPIRFISIYLRRCNLQFSIYNYV